MVTLKVKLSIVRVSPPAKLSVTQLLSSIHNELSFIKVEYRLSVNSYTVEEFGSLRSDLQVASGVIAGCHSIIGIGTFASVLSSLCPLQHLATAIE
jgi:hypothetical protein